MLADGGFREESCSTAAALVRHLTDEWTPPSSVKSEKILDAEVLSEVRRWISGRIPEISGPEVKRWVVRQPPMLEPSQRQPDNCWPTRFGTSGRLASSGLTVLSVNPLKKARHMSSAVKNW